MIDNKMMWMFKISFENVAMIKSFQMWLKNNYENDVSLQKQCGHIIILQWFKNDY
jgi:hypothetical protein